MPVTKGTNRKWRIGSGKAMYKTKAAAMKAYRAYLRIHHSERYRRR